MSNKNQETIADIVDAMRNEGHTGVASCLEWIRVKMTYYADRIEAAWKREREANREKSSQVGNAAKMREAADFFVRNAEMVRQKVLSNAILANIHDLIPMLRYAAETQERCEKVIARCNEAKDMNSPTWTFDSQAFAMDLHEIVNYILRGDAGKEKKMTNKIYTAQKMREALEKADTVFERIFSQDGFIDISYAETREVTEARNEIKAALAEPPRNCDRPECATTKEAQDVWRKEDGGKTAYYEWLLATSTAKGETDGSK